MPEINVEPTLKEKHLTPESFIMHTNMLPSQTLPSSVVSLVNYFN